MHHILFDFLSSSSVPMLSVVHTWSRSLVRGNLHLPRIFMNIAWKAEWKSRLSDFKKQRKLEVVLCG